jgi:hypothetical protein
MYTWDEARIRRLESRIDQLERKEWERREFFLRLITNGFLIAVIIFTTVTITLAATHPGH